MAALRNRVPDAKAPAARLPGGSLLRAARWLLPLPLICFLPLLSVRARTDKPTAADSARNKSIERGEAQFKRSCAMCHGATAMGGIGPNLIQSSLVRHDQGGDLIGPVVSKGRPERGMPAFPILTSGDISDIAAFLQARIDAASVTSSNGLARDESLKPLLTGSAERGKQYFYGAGGCSGCHSPAKDLAGIAEKYNPTELEGRFLSPHGDRVIATVSLSSGQKVQGKLLHLDAFYVAIQDEDGWYRSWPLSQVKVQVNDPLATHRELLGKYSDRDIHDLFAYLETLK
jgi:cytochrome c oxidase cbb3-type subunit III